MTDMTPERLAEIEARVGAAHQHRPRRPTDRQQLDRCSCGVYVSLFYTHFREKLLEAYAAALRDAWDEIERLRALLREAVSKPKVHLDSAAHSAVWDHWHARVAEVIGEVKR